MKNICQLYHLIESREIEEFNGSGAFYEHIRTGAKVFVIRNKDKNKVFTIGFRTTPQDSTGVAHILEHSVLCGSEKYPLKDPFIELAKGSLNTFLNAMTFPDKTIYPIASVNDRDFMNLMDVYLDSVFHPNVYKDSRIFRQEGWHYELLNRGTPDEELKLNGVVYNEMKGAFSNPDSVLESRIMSALYPHTTYAHESGGLPSDIPKLSFEDFLDFHRRYYHPSNAYIYLYGDMDMDEKLMWIDEHYLSHYDKLEIDSHIDKEAPFETPVTKIHEYAVGANEETCGKAYLSESYCIDEEATQVNAIAWQILESVLLSSPGAVLREALIKAGIGEEIYGGICQEVQQPFFTITAKNADISRQEEFSGIIKDALTELAKKGISKKNLRAELNYQEFKLREADCGNMPLGLALGITMFDSWLYDKSPFTFVVYNDAIKELKELIDTDFFEQKIKKCLIDNRHRAKVNIVPSPGLTEREDALLAGKLSEYKDSLSEAEKDRIAEDTKALKAYQAEPDSPENIAMLPVLKLSDIDKAAEKTEYKRDGRLIYSEVNTRGIAYSRIMFELDGLNEDEIQLASLLSDVLGEMNTTRHSYNELYNEILLDTGGISVLTQTMGTRDKGEPGFKGMVSVDIHTLDDKVKEGFDLSAEMLCDTILDDKERLHELLPEIKSRIRAKLEGASHLAAAARASSYTLPGSRFNDLTTGVAYYDFLDAVCRLSREPAHMQRLIDSLKTVRDKIFVPDKVRYAIYGSKAAKAETEKAITDFEARLKEPRSDAGYRKVNIKGHPITPISNLNEGLKTGSQVNYVARCGDFLKAGLKYTGVLKVLKVMLNYDYLWTRLRVLGGAYGCMSGFAKNGRCFLVSYRDPEIGKSLKVYEELPDYLENWDGDESTVAKFIIGAISATDRPLSNADKALTAISDSFFGTTDEELQQERDEILSCTAQDIRACAAYIRALLASESMCTIGSEGQIDREQTSFKSVRDLF